MRVDVQALGLQMPFDVTGPLDAESAGVELASPVRMRGVVFGADGGLRAQGELTAQVRAQCGRCLAEFILPVCAEFDERFVKDGVDNEDFYPYDDAILNLSDLAKDVIWLQMPIAPVCREDCKGLCPQCGADRNTTPCTCACTHERLHGE